MSALKARTLSALRPPGESALTTYGQIVSWLDQVPGKTLAPSGFAHDPLTPRYALREYSEELHRAEYGFLKSLAPREQGAGLEPFDVYRDRVGPLLPSWPNDVLEQWPYRHYSGALEYDWLGFRGLAYRAAMWSTERITTEVETWDDRSLVEAHRDRFLSDKDVRDTWLAAKMLESGTWPTPPLVLTNDSGLRRPDGLRLGAPFHLVEGHHRLGYIWALEADPGIPLAESHRVWVVTSDPAMVMRFWPSNDLPDTSSARQAT